MMLVIAFSLVWFAAIILVAFPQLLTRFFKDKEDKEDD